MKKVVLAIDSFKGCLSSAEAEEAAAAGIRSVCPDCNVLCIPVADGGEGILEVLTKGTNGEFISLYASDPLMKPILTTYGSSANNQMAFIEMATINGLTLVPPGQRNPMKTSSYGMGELIKDALDKGFRQFIIGIGGSATNDAGIGMLQALGFRLMDKDGKEVGPGGENMQKVVSIDDTHIYPGLKESGFTVACDVNNPFCGPEGAACIYAAQKGADSHMIRELDEGMYSFAQVIKQFTGRDIISVPGAGAAGGIGGALLAFMNATLKPGIELVLDTVDFNKKITDADLIITGEGKADKQTCMGKVPYGILQRARQRNIPVYLIAGKTEDEELLKKGGFHVVADINPPGISPEKAMEPEFAKVQITKTVSALI